MSRIHIGLTRKKLILALGAIVSVIAIGFAAWMLLMNSRSEEPSVSEDTKTFDAIIATSAEYSEKGDIDGGLVYYDEQIQQTKDEDEKKQLLVYKASFAQKAGRLDDAIGAAEQAKEIELDFKTAQALALAYDTKGDKTQAILYYKKMLEFSPQEGMSARYNPVWEDRIRELEE